MNKLKRRIIAVIPALIIQLLWLFVLLRWLAPYAAIINLFLSLAAAVFVLRIMMDHFEPAYKTLWLLIILLFPLFGAILYLFLGERKTARPIQRRLAHGRSLLPEQTTDDPALQDALQLAEPRLAQTFRYVTQKTGFDMTPCEEAVYYPLGEAMFEHMLAALRSAERFIFAEYFIVNDGKMWDAMVEIMAQKAAQGVDVRFMYDDLGSISTYSEENIRQLEMKGILCTRFNPLVYIRGTLNYRDHRKMLIIDGQVAFSGGINLADEYINATERFGHWKDIGFKLTGAAVCSYTRMFAEFWNAFSGHPIPGELLTPPAPRERARAYAGYVLSYYDSPLYQDAISNNLYIELLSQATRYAWFYTPYLMLGDNLMDAFVRAAQRGVDVRIIMPGVPDKKLVYRMSRSYYRPLLEAGVKIYEYAPGFVHAKACVIDDVIGTIGTVNLDYRSLFLHFENNSLFYRAPLLDDLKKDFTATQALCVERTLDNMDMTLVKWVIDGILRIFAPLC